MPAKELREADDNQPKIFDLVSGKKKGEQMFQFSIQKRLSVLVRTEDELNWEEARARCQQLGDELEWTESGLHGDLYHFMDEYVLRIQNTCNRFVLSREVDKQPTDKLQETLQPSFISIAVILHYY